MPDPISWSFALPYYSMAILFGYVLGSIPAGLLIAKLAGKGDIRSIGSGNIGATNVLRTGSKKLALLTLIADIGKGFLAVYLCNLWFGIEIGLLAGLGAFLGHCFPIWLRFRGGKGVATYLGVLAAANVKATILFTVIWLLVAGTSRYSSLASIISAIITPISLFILGYVQAGEVFLLLTLILIIKHYSNIQRLASGRESKIGDIG